MKKWLFILALLLVLPSPFANAQTNHLDTVRRVRSTATAEELKTEAGILQVLLRVVCALPSSEKAGLHAKPGGENIAFYAPAGKNVGVSRIMYPDGSLRKVFTDAGPGGANGAGWADDGTIDKGRYIPVSCGSPTTPSNPDDQTPEVAHLQTVIALLTNRIDDLQSRIAAFSGQLANALEAEKQERNQLSEALARAIERIEALEHKPVPLIPTDCYTSLPFLGCGLKF